MDKQDNIGTDDLGDRLAGLTRWTGQGDEVWRGALDVSRRTLGGRVMEIFRTPVRRALPVVLLSLLALVVTVGVLVPSLGRARSSSRLMRVPDLRDAPATNYAYDSPASAGTSAAWSYLGAELEPGRLSTSIQGRAATPVAADSPVALTSTPTPGRASSQSSAAPTDRQVVRKATMELKTPDVRATFLKAGMVVNQALGEFVEASTLTGEGNATGGSLTLRVAAERLSDVLNQLRALGTVVSENATGEDVTSVVVDLEARLRNEQRIETELLELVGKRQDAPLKEVLELRDELGRVRERIEQMTAQRERLGRLVSLATVLVLVRADMTPVVQPVKPPPTIADYFAERIGAAWDSGLRVLVQSVAWLVNVAVGGLVWWLIVAACLVGIRVLVRRGAARRAAEPAPAA